MTPGSETHEILQVSPGLSQVLRDLGASRTESTRNDDSGCVRDSIRILPLLFQSQV